MNKLNQLLSAGLLVFAVSTAQAQVKVGDNPATINANSALEIESANKGLLFPRLELVAPTNPSPLAGHVKGMVIYNTKAVAGLEEGLYANDGTRWSLLNNEKVFASNVLGSNAPSGSCAVGTLYTDTLSTSSTVGRQWTCSGGAWVSYTPATSTPFFLDGTTNDAGGNKWTSITRSGPVQVKWTNGSQSNSTSLGGGNLILTRETDWAGGFIDFKRSHADATPRVRLVYNTPWEAFAINPQASSDEANTFFFKDNGRMGIGVGNPGHKLDINGNIRAVHAIFSGNISGNHITATGNIGAAHASFSGNLVVEGTASKPGGGAWAATSDRRAKENIHPYNKGISELMKINTVTFQYQPQFALGNKTHVGVIAQEIEEVLPSVIVAASDAKLKDFKHVDPSELTYLLINSVKEQQKELDLHKAEIASLKTLLNEKLAKLEKRASKKENRLARKNNAKLNNKSRIAMNP
ncbi:hypothetical protein DSL64_05165 [Dyadobacter luteus]|uniref:Peptidase S74 domain-containing protein n=1 Tax=Dyadobacter luteus TaxID=2259619 RepID=A0A3D8YEV1_9BACT|nr:tail fiber domain-containing protein [Dyadobacter luteus]REA63015.1 hypothetical protein DSL64_05165 [Dyadobacter luteus]